MIAYGARLAFAAPAVLLAAASASCQPQPTSAANSDPNAEQRGSHVWIERPWEIRYFVSVMSSRSLKIAKKVATEYNSKLGPGDSLSWEQVFEPSAAIPLQTPDLLVGDISVVTIEFDKQGVVTTPNAHGSPLRGRLNHLQYIALSAGDNPKDSRYNLGHWFLGLGDVSTHWAPGLCGTKNTPGPFSKTDNLYLYGAKFELTSHSVTFGCREWAHQLYDDERPYIDVTSYVPKDATYDKGSYIREFIGWARFGDKKPVIGKHEDHWYCLHDCPGGEKPAMISDIKVWAEKNGWPVPKRPTKMPVFPDPPAKSGTYPR